AAGPAGAHETFDDLRFRYRQPFRDFDHARRHRRIVSGAGALLVRGFESRSTPPRPFPPPSAQGRGRFRATCQIAAKAAPTPSLAPKAEGRAGEGCLQRHATLNPNPAPPSAGTRGNGGWRNPQTTARDAGRVP